MRNLYLFMGYFGQLRDVYVQIFDNVCIMNFQVINKVPPLVSAGAFAATLSASLSCLIGECWLCLTASNI